MSRPRLTGPASTPAGVAVFSRIITHGPVPRIEISRATGLSQAAVTKAVTPLIEGGYVGETSAQRDAVGAGRPVNPLVVIADRAFAIGVKITADEVIGVVTDLRARIIDSVHRPLSSVDVAEVLATVIAVVQSLRSSSGVHPERVMGVGVAVSGDVDRNSGVIRLSPLLGWREVSLGLELESRLGLPVVVETDVRALTIAEHWFGMGVDAASFAMVTIGAGVGCGIYTNGEVVAGAYGVSGEIGHLPLAGGDLICTCGRRGCVETVASSQAIVRRMHALTGRDCELSEIVDLAHNGDPAARQAFAEAGEVIGSALAAMVNLVGPQLVVIAGEGVAEYDLYADHIRHAFHDHAFGAASNCELVVRSHTFDDWARGAAVTVLRNMVRAGMPGS